MIYFKYKDGNLKKWLHYRKDMTSKSWKYGEETYLFNTSNYYMDNRNKALFYEEGIPTPKNLDGNSSQMVDSATLNSFQQMNINKLFEKEKEGLELLLSKYGILILIVIVVIIFLMMLGK